VPAAVLQGMTQILPANAQVFTPYGATETLPVASIGSRQVLQQTRAQTELGAGVCVGRVVQPVQVAIVRITDQPLANWSEASLCPVGEIAEICVHGPTTTHSYFGRPQATELAKVRRGEQLWHRMGDVGFVDGDGLLWYCGRKGHRVETAAGVLHAAPVEEILNTHPQVRRTALVGVQSGGQVVPLVCVERAPHAHLDDAQLLAELAALALRHPATQVLRL